MKLSQIMMNNSLVVHSCMWRGPTGLSIGDAVKGIGSGLCLSEEMGFAFGVEVII